MKVALVLLSGLVVSGCSGGYPTRMTPPSTSPMPPFLLVFVLSEEGQCIDGATVQVVGGQRLGESQVQKGSPCDRRDLGGGGVFFGNVQAGVPMTLRVSAPGYASQEKTFIPIAVPTGPVDVTLSRTVHNAVVSAIVIDSGGPCLVGAVVEVVRGQLAGARVEQDPNCDYWSGPSNVVFYGLTPGQEMVLRASAPGYRSQERAVVPEGHGRHTPVVFTLEVIK